MTKDENLFNKDEPKQSNPMLTNYELVLKFVKDLANEWNGDEPRCWMDIHEDLFGETPDDAFDRGMSHETQVRAYDAVALLQSIGEWKEDSDDTNL